ncbi:MAG TPA: SgcJ/EcaC family oxidoreductase [Gemmatimonadales bacterium]|nr:SgcJ/EcaC family oxidoreductase [Gemmatimonadales bacterium]
MRRALLILVTVAISAAAGPGSAQSADESEIRSVAMHQGETWSRQDAKAYAALFTEDCDVVNVVGWWWRGRAEVERKLTEAFRFVFRDSRLTITDVNTRFIRPDVAVAHARWTMVGARTPAGIPEPREGIQTLVFTKQSGRWLIAAFQNTHSVPERPFPAGPGEAKPKQ